MSDQNLKQVDLPQFVGDKRLDLFIRLIREMPCQRLVDIGSDHATVPLFLRKFDHCPSVLVTDLREGPLAIAVGRAVKEGITEGFDAVMTNGLDGLDLTTQDILLVSGLGGQTIARILLDNVERAKRPQRIILQPQTHPELLRRSLYEQGFAITDERCVRDRGRTYLVLVCDRDDEPLRSLSAVEAYFGPVILRRIKQMTGISECLHADAGRRGHAWRDDMNERDAMLDHVLTRKRRLEKQAPYKNRARLLLEEFEGYTG
ncbi:MAG TPA: class I SAM-dependent methyltransferase [Clostridia bacterium]|nr:class I SAM-dependent methyltransferase [Clostridia bacterium]